MSEVVIKTRKLTKEYVRDEFHVVALRDADIEIHRGEFVALMGPSGSGKSTLLHLAAAMDRPTKGDIEVLGSKLNTLSDGDIAQVEIAVLIGVGFNGTPHHRHACVIEVVSSRSIEHTTGDFTRGR